jgi:hypothetical protein
MIGQELLIGDIVIYPDGNARYGGLKLTIGVIFKMTEKRVGLATTDLVYNNKPIKTVNKTGKKILKVNDTSLIDLPSFLEIKNFLAR